MMKYSTIFDHSRVGVKKYSKSEYIVFIYIHVYSCILFLTRYVSSPDMTDYYMWNQTRTDRSGNEIGPIVTFNDIDQICNHFKDVEAMNNSKSGMDNYLTTTLNAPPVARYAEFNDTFTEMKGM